VENAKVPPRKCEWLTFRKEFPKVLEGNTATIGLVEVCRVAGGSLFDLAVM